MRKERRRRDPEATTSYRGPVPEGDDDPTVRDDSIARRARQRNTGSSNFRLALILLVVGSGLALLVGALVCVIAVNMARNLPSPAPSAASAVVRVDLAALLSEYKANPVGVTQRYGGQVIEATGFVTKVASNAHRQTYIRLGAQSRGTFIDPHVHIFVLDDELHRRLANFPVGSRATVQFTISGVNSTLRANAVEIRSPD